MVDLIILGAVALFVLYRLYKTLGEDNGPPQGKSRHTVVTPFPNADTARKQRAGYADSGPTEKRRFTGPAAAALNEIYEADPSFDQREFLAGAQSFYGMVVEAFQQGDKETLEPWLDEDVKEMWFAAIDVRDETYVPWVLRQFRFADIESASFVDNIARIDVKFEASLARDNATQRVREVWTLMRDVTSDSPNWLLDDVEATQ